METAQTISKSFFTLVVVPETSGRWHEELDDIFQARVSTRAFKNHVCSGLGAHITDIDRLDVKKDDATEEQWVEK